MKTGFCRISDSEYHSTEALSKTGIKALLRSPAHFKAPVEPSPAMVFGTAYHMAVFQDAEYQKQYIAKPENMTFTTKEGKAWRDYATSQNKQIIKAEDHEKIMIMRERIFENDIARDLLASGEPELAAFWGDPIYGFLCKLKLDWLNKKKRILVDLKSCIDARPHAFTNAAYAQVYHLQAAWYLYGVTHITGVEHREFYFIAQEKEYPFAVQVYQASEEMINQGLVDCQRALLIYNDCMASKEWPAYPMKLQSLSLPGWVLRKEQQSIIE